MQIKQTITLFGTVSNSATSRISKNGRKYTAFGVAIISDRNLQAFHYNVVAFGKQGHFAKPLQTGTRIKLVVQAQSQPDNIASIPLLTATFVRPVRPVCTVGRTSLSCLSFLLLDRDDSPIEVVQAGMTSHEPTSEWCR